MSDNKLIEEAEKVVPFVSKMLDKGVADFIQSLADALEAATRERDAALAAVERVRVIHRNAGPSQGYDSRFKGGYGMLGDCCAACGSHGEYGVEWPCPTVAALDGAPEPEANIEYGVLTPERTVWHVTDDLDEARTVAKDNPGDSVEYRHRVGPWLPVEGESK